MILQNYPSLMILKREIKIIEKESNT